MVLHIFSTLILVYILSPVHMYYVYDETSNVGFVNENDKSSLVGQDINQASQVVSQDINQDSSNSGIRDPLSYSLHSMYSKFGAGKRFHSNARSGSFMVDSHFRVLKASPTSAKADQRVIKFNLEQMPPRTEAPMEQRKYIEEEAAKSAETKAYLPINGYAQANYVHDGSNMNAGIPHTKPYSKVTKDHHDPYLINVHRTQVTSGQKVKFNSNQFANIRRHEGDVSVSAMAHQNKLEEINTQAKNKYTQINQKKLDRRHDATEYQKDSVTASGLDINLMKMRMDKDNFKLTGRVADVPRIGGWEESVEVKPYALFYRISQDPNMRQFDNVQHFMNDDDNVIKADNFAEHVIQDIPAMQPTISPSSIKLRMKIKKYSNFRSH